MGWRLSELVLDRKQQKLLIQIFDMVVVPFLNLSE